MLDIGSKLQVLVDLRISRIGRAADLLWIQFGELNQIPSTYGTRTVGEWALHVQTSWRFVDKDDITIGIGDVYVYPNGDPYDWELGGDSNFDLIAKELNKSFSERVTVRTLNYDHVGGFVIEVSNGSQFEVFPKISSKIPGIEHWRLFQPAKDGEHFICSTSEQ